MIALLLSALALAAPGGSVEALWAVDAEGRWRSVDATGEVWCERDGEVVPLTVGTPLETTDRIVTQRGRVELRLAGGDRVVTVYEDATLTVEDWGVLHDLGTLLYRVRGAFEVRYGTVEALVEGTRFWVVAGTEGGLVTVEQGRVRVRNAHGEMLLKRGNRAAAVSETSAPTSPPASLRRDSRRLRWGLWGARRPLPVELGLLLHTGASRQVGQTALGPRLGAAGLARVSLPGPLALTATTGMTNTTETTSFPTDLGLSVGSDLWSVGAQGRVRVGTEAQCKRGTMRVVTRYGGSAVVTAKLPLGSRTALEGRAVGGWASGPWVDTGMSLLWQL